MVTWPYLVLVFVTVVYLVSVVGLVTVRTPDVTPVLVTVIGEECLIVLFVTRTSSNTLVVVITAVVVFSGEAFQYGTFMFEL